MDYDLRYPGLLSVYNSKDYKDARAQLISDIAKYETTATNQITGVETKFSSLASIKIANKRATSKSDGGNPALNPDLYKAIGEIYTDDDGKPVGWPVTEKDYEAYLLAYATMVPSEGTYDRMDNWAPWQSTPYNEGYTQKTYDLLCHFYWLIDQTQDTANKCDKKTLQSFADFMDLINTFNKYVVSRNLDSPESARDLKTFESNPMYNLDELYTDECRLWKNHKAWKSFNEFFYRQMDGADPTTGIAWNLRPIASFNDPNVIVAPAECTFKAIYNIDSIGNVVAVVDGRKSHDNIIKPTLKRTHKIGNVFDLLKDSMTATGVNYGEMFLGGTYVHAFLSPFDYHRFHCPVAGRIVYMKRIFAGTYLKVDLSDADGADAGQFEANDDALNGYEFTQSRGIIIQECGEYGYVATIPVGMADVSGVVMYDGCRGDDPNRPDERVPDVRGKYCVKGEEFGKFKFGGSDIIMLFTKNPEYFFMHSPDKQPIHFQYGQQFAYFNVVRD